MITVPRPAPSEPREHSTSVEHSLWPLQSESSEHPTGTPLGVVGVSDNQPVSEPTKQSKTGGNLLLKPAPSEIAEIGRGIIAGKGDSASAATRLRVTIVGGSTTDGSAGNHGEPL